MMAQAQNIPDDLGSLKVFHLQYSWQVVWWMSVRKTHDRLLLETLSSDPHIFYQLLNTLSNIVHGTGAGTLIQDLCPIAASPQQQPNTSDDPGNKCKFLDISKIMDFVNSKSGFYKIPLFEAEYETLV